MKLNFSGSIVHCLQTSLALGSDGDLYRMWFCARGKAYRIYCAESADGISWDRRAEPDIGVSDSGWDSEMVEYPFVFDHKSDRYMLYAGNDFGRTGFGLARLEMD